MRNVEIEKKGDKMLITVDLKKDFGLSKSGKTIIVASTGGNQEFEGVVVGLNVYKKQ